MDSTSFWMARKSAFARPGKGTAEVRVSRPKAGRIMLTNPLRRARGEAAPEARTEPLRSESLSTIYLTTGSDVAADGSHPARWVRRLSATAGFRTARGRLPHDSGGYVLSRRQPGRDGLGRNRAFGAAVRSGAGAQS